MADPLKEDFLDFVRRHQLLEEGERVVVGVSGGVDSLVLLHLLRESFRPLAVHVDHGMREESAADAAFVAGLASSWGVEAKTVRITVPPGASRQAQARRERYRALEEVAQEERVHAVAVGHQRDDVAETLLLQLIRGAGPRGWRAMPVSRPLSRGASVRLIRPLRFASRGEIEAYARAHDITWLEDPSNAALAYRRAVIRKRVMPLLGRYFGEGVADRIAAAAELAEDYLEAGAALASDEALETATPEPGSLSIEALTRMDPVIRRGVIIETLAREHPDAPRSTAVVAAVERLLESQVGRRVEVGPVSVWRERDVLRLTRERPVRFVGNVSVPGRLDAPQGTLTIEALNEVPSPIDDDCLREMVDAGRLGEVLVLRTWQEGDRFTPLGMEGTKKVSDFLTDRRVPSNVRADQLVLVSEGRIVWVVGHRLAEAFRLRPETRRAALLAWRPAAAEGR